MGVHAKVADVPGERTMALSARFDARAVQFQQKDGRWVASLDAVFVQRDGNSQVLSGVEHALQLNLPEAKYQEALRDGIGYAKEIGVSASATELRVILRDATSGKLGAVSVPLAKHSLPRPKILSAMPVHAGF
jgi:hypothetical protein